MTAWAKPAEEQDKAPSQLRSGVHQLLNPQTPMSTVHLEGEVGQASQSPLPSGQPDNGAAMGWEELRNDITGRSQGRIPEARGRWIRHVTPPPSGNRK